MIFCDSGKWPEVHAFSASQQWQMALKLADAWHEASHRDSKEYGHFGSTAKVVHSSDETP